MKGNVCKLLREGLIQDRLVFLTSIPWNRHYIRGLESMCAFPLFNCCFSKWRLLSINMSMLIFAQLHSDKKQISVGFIGYPNVGKSSVINTLRSKKVCNVAPLAGETKVRLQTLFLSISGMWFQHKDFCIFHVIHVNSEKKKLMHFEIVIIQYKIIIILQYNNILAIVIYLFLDLFNVHI